MESIALPDSNERQVLLPQPHAQSQSRCAGCCDRLKHVVPIVSIIALGILSTFCLGTVIGRRLSSHDGVIDKTFIVGLPLIPTVVAIFSDPERRPDFNNNRTLAVWAVSVILTTGGFVFGFSLPNCPS